MAKGDITAKLVDYVVSYTRSEGQVQVDGMVAVWMEGLKGNKNTIESVQVSQTFPLSSFNAKTILEIEDALKVIAEQRSDQIKELSANPKTGKKID